MSDEIGTKADNATDGDKVNKDETDDNETKEPKQTKQRSVSFNRDVHVKRFGKPRERGTSSEHQQPSIRKEPFTHLSEQELIEEANKVLAQAKSVTCTADHPPEKFFSLPHRRKFKEDKSGRRNSDDTGSPEGTIKSPLGRSTSDVTAKKRKERTSLSTLFRRAQRNKSPDVPVVVSRKPVVVVKRSKSDVSDLKSNTTLSSQNKPIRKRSGSETEEFLKSLRNKKSQLSPIIESSPREDYFKKTPPLDVFQREKLKQKITKSEDQKPLSLTDIKKVNPVEKPPRYKTPDKQETKELSKVKRGKSGEKEKETSPPIADTPKRKTDIKRTTLFDESNTTKSKGTNQPEIKDKIKETIKKVEENIYGDKEMKHSSQQPPQKPPLTRGQTVDQLVKILKEDQDSPPPKTHLIAPSNGSNINQPFSYTKPSTSPDPNLFVRTTSPDRVPTPVNQSDKTIVYAEVLRDSKDTMPSFGKIKNYSPGVEKYGNYSDEDEGLGYEERYKYSTDRKYDYKYRNKDNENFRKFDEHIESPVRSKYREYKLMNFEDYEPTYANEYPSKEDTQNNFDSFRGRGDGMDNKRKQAEPEITKLDLDFNELSHRRELLESRLNARRLDRAKINLDEPITKFIVENDPIYEAEKRMKATEKYVNETARYYRHTLERDGYVESNVTEDFNKYDSENLNVKYNTESRTFQKIHKNDERRIRNLSPEPRYKEERKVFPPEPEYEPPSLESNPRKPIHSPNEYTEKKYKVKKQFTSSHDLLQSGQKYKGKDDWFGKRKGHYASNPEIAQEREDDYSNLRYNGKHCDSYHSSLRRNKNNRHYKEDFGISRHDSGDSRDYYREERSPRRFDFDNRLVDSGIENDFRKDSSGEIHRTRHRRHESDDDVHNTSLFLASERRHTEDNYPAEQIYANGEYLATFKDYKPDERKEYVSRERSTVDGSFDTKHNRYDKSPSRYDEKVSTKPPKATKKLSGLEKMKQLFSRDSSKKSKKEKEIVQPKTRTRVLKSPEHLARDDPEYRRYTDPEPSDIDVKKRDYDPKEVERKYKSSREDLNRYTSSDSRDVNVKKYTEYDRRYDRTLKGERRYKSHEEEKGRYNSSDRDSDHQSRPSDIESDRRKTRSRTAGPLDSPALAERYRERRRLATPSPTPSPPRRQAAPQPQPTPQPTSGNWLKSLDRLGKKREKSINSRVEKDSIITTEDESSRRVWSKSSKPLNSPAKNLRFFGDTDQESEGNVKQTVTKSKSHPHSKSHSTLRKTISNSSTGLDEVDHSELSNKSYSMSNLYRDEQNESPRTKQYYKRNLQNISEIQSNSETESQFDRKTKTKPPISPYDRSRSHSSSKTLKGSKNDIRRHARGEERGSSSELRSSKHELSRDGKLRRRTPVANSGESSTEGDSSHQSQRSVVYLHATTVGDIPDPGRLTRNRSRDDVSSVMSSNVQVRSTTKSFSLFAPWTPRHYDQQDVHYAQKPKKTKQKESVFKKSQSRTDSQPTLQKNKSYSQTTLGRRPQSQSRLSSSSTTLYRRDKRSGRENGESTISRRGPSAKKSQSSEVLNRDERDRVSRSISMPKDQNKKAGWFKLSNKNKKTEVNTRVR
ncbi:zinc finger CCCH domain-containing protein 13 [Battus philenor]|uniref:zinc finger CCCH domain-containing protein 13 n=1 Tax=Battus philenor TaxID=42288 RepID=UPI0035D04F8D